MGIFVNVENRSVFILVCDTLLPFWGLMISNGQPNTPYVGKGGFVAV